VTDGGAPDRVLSPPRRDGATESPDEEDVMRERESFLKRLDERLSRMSGWLAERQRGDEKAVHARLEALRRELADARRAVAETAKDDLARVHASLEDMRADYDVPPPNGSFTRAELEAFRRHLHTTARLLHDLSTADSPRWAAADEEYDRSWTELLNAVESKGGTTSPSSS
jgi:hypothetical protein